MASILHEQFLQPPEEFTPIPFWFWNDNLTKEEITGQIRDFHDKGVTGFVLHPRIGIPKEIEYLSDFFMELVHTAVEEAKQLGMSVILYDEAMYPSGAAKGLVVKDNPEYASRGLKMIEYPCNTNNYIKLDLADSDRFVSAQAVKKLSAESINLSSTQILDYEDGLVQFSPPDEDDWSVLVFVETFSGGHIRGIHFGEDDGEENPPASADLLNPEAVAKFIRITHDTYYNTLKDYFGDTVIAMFTDEPDILGRGSAKGLKPWTADFLTFYKNAGNEETHLAALWFDVGNQTKTIRKNYRKVVNKKLTEAYYGQISKWCEEHNIALTGHPAASDDIGLLEQFQIPGQDVVWRWMAPEDGKALEGEHSTAGKCSADAARHRGRRRNLNEFLGVCGKETAWALSAGDMKWYMDWLLVRGVNLLCPHAFYYSIDGERRSHERPPDVGPNNLWWPYYKQFSQYMKRLSWLMTDSTNQTAVAVLCEEDHLPWKITKPLFENQIEFNYLEESLLVSSCQVEDGNISIANQNYQVVIIEDSTKLEPAVVEKLDQFTASGGEVIICTSGNSPAPVKGAKTISSEEDVVDAISAWYRDEVEIFPKHKDIRVSKVNKAGQLFYLFVNEGEENYEGIFRVKEKGQVEKWDAWTGSITEAALIEQNEQLVTPLVLERRTSFVYHVNTNKAPLLKADSEFANVTTEKIELNEGWLIHNKQGQKLESWLNWDGMESFSGTVTYETEFTVENNQSMVKIELDLGEVYEMVDVSVNDLPVGVKMWAPYRLDIDPTLLKSGSNRLRVDVINNRANEMDDAKLPSGLLGPVTLNITRG